MKNVYGFSTSYLYWYDLISAQEKYSVMLDKINAAIKHYNLDIEQKKKLTDNLIYINKAIAARSLKDQFSQYRQHLAERNLCESALRDTEENLWKLDSEIAEILSKKAQVSIALDFINEALAYIFFNNKRLVLEKFLRTVSFEIKWQGCEAWRCFNRRAQRYSSMLFLCQNL